MGFRFLRFRFGRQFTSDVRTLFSRHARGSRSFADRWDALDRIAGSLFLLGGALGAIWFVSQRPLPQRVDVPTVAETAQAASDAPGLPVQGRAVEASIQPLSTDEIRKLQHWLVMVGLDPGPVDGRAGPRTLNAFNQYPASQNLDPVLRIDRAAAAELLE
jgi:hypothetical protein